MTDIEKMEFLISELENGVKKKFCERVGIDMSRLSHWLAGDETITARSKQRILDAYPEIERDWLMDGVGYPGNLSLKSVRRYYETLLAEKDITIRNLSETIVNLTRK